MSDACPRSDLERRSDGYIGCPSDGKRRAKGVVVNSFIGVGEVAFRLCTRSAHSRVEQLFIFHRTDFGPMLAFCANVSAQLNGSRRDAPGP